MRLLLRYLSTILTASVVFNSAVVHADSVSGSVSAAPGSAAPVNLNSFTSFAFYGTGSTPATDTSNIGDFSALTLVAGTPAISGSGASNSDAGNIELTYSNATSSATNSESFYNVGSRTAGQVGESFSLTSQLFATTETFTVYLSNYDTTSDFNVELGSTSLYSATDVVLPTAASNANGTGTGNTYGVLNLTVTGSIGETLTFSDAVDPTGVSNAANENIGINAIAVTGVVPEPTAWGLLLVGCVGLGLMRRFKLLGV